MVERRQVGRLRVLRPALSKSDPLSGYLFHQLSTASAALALETIVVDEFR
jgi:hypothetical protein